MEDVKSTKRFYVVKRTSPARLKVITRPMKSKFDAECWLEFVKGTESGNFLIIECEGYDKKQL